MCIYVRDKSVHIVCDSSVICAMTHSCESIVPPPEKVLFSDAAISRSGRK